MEIENEMNDYLNDGFLDGGSLDQPILAFHSWDQSASLLPWVTRFESEPFLREAPSPRLSEQKTFTYIPNSQPQAMGESFALALLNGYLTYSMND